MKNPNFFLVSPRNILFSVCALAFTLSSSSQAACTYTITNNWGSGFTGEIKVTNNTAQTVNGWSVSWQEASASITSAWNVTLTGANPYTATALSWNATLAPNASASFGFQGNGTAGAPTISGSLCGAVTSSSAKTSSSSATSSSVKTSTSSSTSSNTSTSSSKSSSSIASSVASSAAEGNWVFEENALGFCGDSNTVATNHTGYTGTGFVDIDNALGSSLSWSVSAASAKTYSAQIRFGHGGSAARRATVVVNDKVIKTLDFPTNSNWDLWQTVNVDMPLVAGTNSVKLVAETADGLANIDSITVTGNGITPAACPVVSTKTPAFPTAEGFGMWATGGRGGKVVEVTTLQDNVTGSLRWALQQYSGQPLTVVFRVSGIIDLKGVSIRAKRDNLTIAGQSAPGEGVLIKGGKLNLGGSNNLIVRNLRARVGSLDDGTFIEGGAIGFENGNNAIFDHCTFGWSSEENMTVYDDVNLTIQWSIVHEGLYNAGHPKGSRGYGAQWGGVSSTFHHNLLAHNVTRSPRFNGARSNDTDVLVDFVNNVVYNWGTKGFAYGGDIENNTHRANVVNNYYKPGPAYPGNKASLLVNASYSADQGSKVAVWYMQGNYMEGSANTGNNSDNYNGLDVSSYISALGSFDKNKAISKTIFSVASPIKTESASSAYTSVLAKAGALPRDAVDKRIVNEVTNGSASGKGTFNNNANVGIIDNPSGVGGFPSYKAATALADADADGIPDQWESNNGLNPNNAADGAQLHSSGYSWLELYLNGLMGEKIQGVNY